MFSFSYRSFVFALAGYCHDEESGEQAIDVVRVVVVAGVAVRVAIEEVRRVRQVGRTHDPKFRT